MVASYSGSYRHRSGLSPAASVFPPCAWGACFISMPGPVGPRTPLTAASLSQAATGPGAAGTPGVGAEASRGAWRAAWKGQLGQGVEWIGVVVLKGGREGPPPKWEDETSLLRDWFPCAGAVLSLAQTHRGGPQTTSTDTRLGEVSSALQ